MDQKARKPLIGAALLALATWVGLNSWRGDVIAGYLMPPSIHPVEIACAVGLAAVGLLLVLGRI